MKDIKCYCCGSILEGFNLSLEFYYNNPIAHPGNCSMSYSMFMSTWNLNSEDTYNKLNYLYSSDCYKYIGDYLSSNNPIKLLHYELGVSKRLARKLLDYHYPDYELVSRGYKIVGVKNSQSLSAFYLQNPNYGFCSKESRSRALNTSRLTSVGLFDPKTKQKSLINRYESSNRSIIELLVELSIDYIQEYYLECEVIEGIPYYRYYDFYLPKFNLILELDGSYHKRFGKYDVALDDKLKDELAVKFNHQLIRIDTTDKLLAIKSIRDIMENLI